MRVEQTSFVHFLFNILSSILGFVATVYFARVLGAGILGEYALLLSLVIWLKLGVQVGIPIAITKRISEGVNQGQYATAGVIIIAILCIIFSIPVLLFGNWIDIYVGRQVHRFVILLVVASAGFALVTSLLEGLRDVHLAGLLSPVRVTSRSLVQAGLVAVGAGLVGLLIGYFVGTLIATVLGVILVARRIQFRLPEQHHFERIFDFAKYAWIQTVGSRGFNWIDITILGLFVQSSLIGIYSIAWNVASFLSLFSNSIENTIFPEVSKLLENGDREDASRLFSNSLKYAGLFAIPGLVGGYILGDDLLAVFGDEFRAGSHILVLLIGSTLFFSYQRQFRSLLNASDYPDKTLLFSSIHSYFEAIRVIKFNLPIKFIFKQLFSSGMMGTILLVVIESSIMPELPYPEVRVLILVGIGAGIYFLILTVISPDFRTTIRRNILDI
jgi:O-antigen/teichoic acid export membrane protein